MKRIMLIIAALALMLSAACGGEEAAQDEPGADTAQEESAEVAETPVEDTDVEAEDDGEMTEEDKLAYVMENCICPQCPSWIPEASEKGEGGYCATGMSECIVEEAGCVCPDCPVTEEMDLEWGYYCTRGSAEEMMAAESETE